MKNEVINKTDTLKPAYFSLFVAHTDGGNICHHIDVQEENWGKSYQLHQDTNDKWRKK